MNNLAKNLNKNWLIVRLDLKLYFLQSPFGKNSSRIEYF